MARRHRAEKRIIIADPKYGSTDLAKFINRVMMGGKKSTAQRAVYAALDIAEDQAKRPGIDIFDLAVRNAVPALEVKSRRVGGALRTTQVRRRAALMASRCLSRTSGRRSAHMMPTCWALRTRKSSRSRHAAEW